MQITLNIPDQHIPKIMKTFGLDDDDLYPTNADKKQAFLNILISFVRERVKSTDIQEYKQTQPQYDDITGS